MNVRTFWTSFLLLGLMGCAATSPSGNQSASQSAASQSNSPSASNKPKVVASYSVLCDLTQTIAQDTIDLKCLMPAGQDPHTYQPTPDDRKAIDAGALVLYGGYDFEPGIIKLVKAAGNPATKVAIHEIAVPKPIMGEHMGEHGGEHDHDQDAPSLEAETKSEQKSETKSEMEADPHVWHNAQNGIAIVQVLQDKLSQIAPQNADLYRKNAKTLTDRLTKLDGWIKQSIATIPVASRKLVTTHDALTYYSVAYGLPIEGALQGLSTDEKPTATRIKALVDSIKGSKVPMIFAEITANPKLIETVAKEANVKLSTKSIFADGLGEKASGAETYEQMLVSNTTTIVEGLGGQVPPKP